MKDALAVGAVGAVAAVIAIVLSAICSLPVMLLWDWLMPTLFGLSTITWPQAWGLLVLTNLLFKGFEATVNK